MNYGQLINRFYSCYLFKVTTIQKQISKETLTLPRWLFCDTFYWGWLLQYGCKSPALSREPSISACAQSSSWQLKMGGKKWTQSLSSEMYS